MRSSIGNSMLLSLVIIFVTTIIIIFLSVLSYSKAYRVKNRIIEIIEEEYNESSHLEEYDNQSGLTTGNPMTYDMISDEIVEYLHKSGYKVGRLNPDQCKTKLQEKGVDISNPDSIMYNGEDYKFCIGKKSLGNGVSYVVITYVEFNLPIIGDLTPASVSGETRTLGLNYQRFD